MRRRVHSTIMNRKKDYAYRGTWEHQLSRARNLAQRGGLTKTEMMARYGRFPKRDEWWGPEKDRLEWEREWKRTHPKPHADENLKSTTKVEPQSIVVSPSQTPLVR